LILLLAATAAAFTAGQEPAPLSTFRASTLHVTVDVIATDASGRLVRDLSAEDFTVLQDGRRQKLSDFRLVSHSSVSSAELDAPNTGGDVATNLLPADARLFLLLVDDLHLLPSDLPYTKIALTGFLESLGPKDQVALIFGGRSSLGVAPTTDRRALADAVGRLKEAFGFGLSPVDERILATATRKRHLRSLIWTLKNIAAGLSTSPHSRCASSSAAVRSSRRDRTH
jgi:VWFA-related protein